MRKVRIVLPQLQRDIEKYSSYIGEITDLPEIEEVLVFPDVVLKKKYIEADYKCAVPSGLAIVSSDGAVYPQLRSRGIGCGMIVFRTGLTASNENIEGYEKVFKKIQSSRSLKNRIYRKIHLNKWIEGGDRVGNKEWPEVHNTDIRGYLVSKLGVTKAEDSTKFFEAEGKHLIRGVKYNEYYSDSWLNRKSRVISSGLSGLVFAGNHFLELQKIESLSTGDNVSKSDDDLKNNELVIMAHLGGGRLENILRKDIVERVIHFDYYKPIYKDDILYEVIKESVGLLKNLGALQRAALFVRVIDAIGETFSPDIAESLEPISECTHNDIDFSDVSGSIIYRHNLAKLYKGRLTIVSGRDDHPSYLVSSGPSSVECSDSIDHGIGEYLLFCKKVDSDTCTKKILPIRYFPGTFKELPIPHFKDSRGEDLLKAYKESGILEDVIKLVPILSLNG